MSEDKATRIEMALYGATYSVFAHADAIEELKDWCRKNKPPTRREKYDNARQYLDYVQAKQVFDKKFRHHKDQINAHSGTYREAVQLLKELLGFEGREYMINDKDNPFIGFEYDGQTLYGKLRAESVGSNQYRLNVVVETDEGGRVTTGLKREPDTYHF